MSKEETKIPTAKEFLLEDYDLSSHSEQGKVWTSDVIEKMVEFAKLHVQQALKEASEKAILNGYNYKKSIPENVQNLGQEVNPDSDDPSFYISTNKDSILSSYPLENIK